VGCGVAGLLLQRGASLWAAAADKAAPFRLAGHGTEASGEPRYVSRGGDEGRTRVQFPTLKGERCAALLAVRKPIACNARVSATLTKKTVTKVGF
jgi:hypothetical protein